MAKLVEMVDTEDPAFGKIATILIDMRTADVEIDEASVGHADETSVHALHLPGDPPAIDVEIISLARTRS